MSFVTKYNIQFRDTWNLNWQILIQEDAWGGVITNLTPTGNALKIEYNTDSDEFNDPVRPSKTVFNVWAQTDFQLIDLYSDEDFHFKVLIYAGGVLKWQGFIVTSEFSEPYDCTPYPVQITAVDGLNYLKNITYDDDGDYYNGRLLESQIILDILLKIQVTQFTEYINIYEEGMNVTVNDSPLDQVYIDVDLFRDMKCYDVLFELCTKYNAVVRQSEGEIIIYRPVELVSATVYGREFTGATTKSATSFTSTQYINRTANASDLWQFPGSELMVRPPAKKIIIAQNYGYKDSWIDNWEVKGTTYDEATGTWDNWTNAGAGLNSINDFIPAENDGFAITGHAAKAIYVYQQFGAYVKSTANVIGFSVDYLLYNFSSSEQADVEVYIKVKPDGSNHWLYGLSDGSGDWDTSTNYLTLIHTLQPGSSGWFSFALSINTGLPTDGPYTITLYGPNNVYVISSFKNIKIFSTSNSIVNKTTRSVWQRLRAGGVGLYWLGLTNKYFTEISQSIVVVKKEYIIENAINGIDLNYSYLLGDVADSEIDNVIEQFAGALSTGTKQYRVDTITLTGTSGSADILCGGISGEASWNTSLTQTAADFVTDYAAGWATIDITLTSSGPNIIFTGDILGAEFTGETTIEPDLSDLDGTVVHTTPAHDVDELEYTTDWNTRGGSESTTLLAVIGGEIGNQYSRPKQLNQMTIQEMDETDTVLNVIGHFEDDVNKISTVNRKFVFQSGEFDVVPRRWTADLLEIIE